MFGKTWCCASQEVIIELLKMKCLPVPVLFYGLESCPLNKAQIKSLDFAINRAFSKIFCTESHNLMEAVGLYVSVSMWLTGCLGGRKLLV